MACPAAYCLPTFTYPCSGCLDAATNFCSYTAFDNAIQFMDVGLRMLAYAGLRTHRAYTARARADTTCHTYPPPHPAHLYGLRSPFGARLVWTCLPLPPPYTAHTLARRALRGLDISMSPRVLTYRGYRCADEIYTVNSICLILTLLPFCMPTWTHSLLARTYDCMY